MGGAVDDHGGRRSVDARRRRRHVRPATEVQMFERVPSPDEIKKVYAAGRSGMCVR
jgi:hypothetical protein